LFHFKANGTSSNSFLTSRGAVKTSTFITRDNAEPLGGFVTKDEPF